jgi:hypothetical protein
MLFEPVMLCKPGNARLMNQPFGPWMVQIGQAEICDHKIRLARTHKAQVAFRGKVGSDFQALLARSALMAQTPVQQQGLPVQGLPVQGLPVLSQEIPRAESLEAL